MPRRALLDEERLRALALEQDRVVGRDQLAFLGADRYLVARRVDTGRWRAIGTRVVLVTTGELTYRQRLWVAVLHSGPASALAGLTAAEAEGLRGFSSATLHTVVPHGSDATDLDDAEVGVRVRVAQSRRLADALVHPVRTPRRLLLPHAVVDAASSTSSERRARLIVIATVQQRLARPEELRAVVRGRNRLAQRALITEAIDDAEGGVHSLPEGDWTRTIRRFRLPEPSRQQRVRRSDGTWYLDADFQPWGVSVEINGTQHLLAGAVTWDDHRRNVLGTGGRLVITLSSYDVRHRPGVAVIATAAALLSRGWQPSPAVLRGLRRLAGDVGMRLEDGDWLPHAS